MDDNKKAILLDQSSTCCQIRHFPFATRPIQNLKMPPGSQPKSLRPDPISTAIRGSPKGERECAQNFYAFTCNALPGLPNAKLNAPDLPRALHEYCLRLGALPDAGTTCTLASVASVAGRQTITVEPALRTHRCTDAHPSFLMMGPAALLLGVLLTLLVVPGLRAALGAHPAVAAALLLVAVGWAVAAWRGRRGAVREADDLSPSELTTLTFPPERRLRRSYPMSRH